MTTRLKRFDMIMGFRLLTLLFSFILFSIYATPLNIANHAFIIVSLLIVNVIIILLQREKLDGLKSTILWSVEIIGIFIILLLTGGINSLYFWMILNPMLVGLNTNEKIHKSQHLVLVVFMIVLYKLSRPESAIDELHSIQMLFGIIVVVLYSYVTGVILRGQQRVNSELLQMQINLKKTAKANRLMSENLMESVVLLEKIAIVEEYDSVIDMFSEYLEVILGKERCFFITQTTDDYLVCDFLKYPTEETIEFINENQLDKQSEADLYQYQTFDNTLVVFSKLKCEDHVHFYGYALTDDEWIHKDMILQQLRFVAKLHRIIIAKLHMFKLKRELLIKDEQNRIAEEMHDNVNQQLFALTCQVYNLKNELNKEVDVENIKKSTSLIYNTLSKTSKDLKEIIYRMSLDKGNNKNVLDGVMSYIENLSSLYHIEIEYNIDDNVLNCDGKTQNSLMRIINETIANAVKHGKAKKLLINMKEKQGNIHVTVLDNGIGISQFDLMKKEKGIGISNLKKIAEIHNGDFKISSKDLVNGTKVEIVLKEVNIQ